MKEEEKLLYLVKTFSRTKRKDYENYVINAIWNRVNNFNLYPVSQQYVKKDDGTYYLIDLYFPQLNIGIEVDEPMHEKRQEEDRIREMNIFDMLSLISEKEYEAKHIKISDSFDEVEQRIDEVVDEIKNSIDEYEKQQPFVFSRSVLKDYSKELAIHVEDLACFSTITEAANTILGKDYKGQQHCSFDVKENYRAWFPRLGIRSERNNGWENSITADGQYIYEKSEDNIPLSLDSDTKRVVFAQTKSITGKRIYRFVGVFMQKRKSADDTFEYERISTEFEIIRYEY